MFLFLAIITMCFSSSNKKNNTQFSSAEESFTQPQTPFVSFGQFTQKHYQVPDLTSGHEASMKSTTGQDPFASTRSQDTVVEIVMNDKKKMKSEKRLVKIAPKPNGIQKNDNKTRGGENDKYDESIGELDISSDYYQSYGNGYDPFYSDRSIVPYDYYYEESTRTSLGSKICGEKCRRKALRFILCPFATIYYIPDVLSFIAFLILNFYAEPISCSIKNDPNCDTIKTARITTMWTAIVIFCLRILRAFVKKMDKKIQL